MIGRCSADALFFFFRPSPLALFPFLSLLICSSSRSFSFFSTFRSAVLCLLYVARPFFWPQRTRCHYHQVPCHPFRILKIGTHSHLLRCLLIAEVTLAADCFLIRSRFRIHSKLLLFLPSFSLNLISGPFLPPSSR